MNMKKLVMSLVVTGVIASMLCLSAMAAVAELRGTEYDTVQEAVDAAVAGDNVIQLLADDDGIIDENVFIIQQKDINITVKGSEDIVYTGGFEICGAGRSYTCESGSPAAETLTFDGINFNGEDKTAAFDFFGSQRKNTLPNGVLVWNHPHNVTVKNCTFVGNYDYDKAVVAIRNVGGYNWTVENCTGEGLHSFMQASANTLSSKIDNLTLTECESGLNLGTNANYTITNSTFDVVEFAVRADINSNFDVNLLIDNCKVNAAEAFVFRKNESIKNYNVTISNSKIVSSVADITRNASAKDTDKIYFTIDNNYWGGDAPVIPELEGFVDEVLPYYKDEDMTQLGGVEAIYDGELYKTLADAIDAAEAAGGDAVVTLVADVIAEAGYYSNVGNNGALNSLVIELDGYTITINNDWKIFTDITLRNGSIKSETIVGTSPFYMFMDAAGKTYDATFENVDIISKNNGGYAFISPNGGDADATFKFVNCDIDVSDYESWVSVINAQGGIKVVLDKTNITATNGGSVFVNVTNAEITESTITAENMAGAAFRNFAGTVTDSEIIVTGAKNGIKNDADLALTIGGESSVKITGSTEYDINLADTATIAIEDTTSVLADSVNKIENVTAADTATFVSKADSIEVKFVKVDEEEVNGEMVDNKEGEDLYNINLVGANAEIINRLNSVDLTFVIANTTGKTAFELIASNDEVVIAPVNNSTTRYEFHYNGKDGVKTDVAEIITLGQVKFTGYGIYTFAVDATADTNIAHATTLSDNIVDTFVPNDTATVDAGELVIENAKIEAEIFVPTRDLIINIDFPNAIEDNEAAYQDMTVTVSGAELETALVVELGKNGAITDLDEYITKTSADKAVTAVFENGAYKVTVTDLLNVDTTYQVTVEGEGYRTAYYSVTMNCAESKTLNFWNNVKDNTVEVEEGKASSADDVTFLAGDIVKDSVINIYDLSAVVSYFGEVDLNKLGTANEYVKYDLNRDGKIDSKDVAYVLVSWGK